MKRILISFLLLLLLLPISVSAGAQETTHIQDFAGLLSAQEQTKLESRLREAGEQWGVTVAVVTVDSLGGKSATQYADDYFDDQGKTLGWGEDGILLLIAMQTRDWAVSTTGKGIEAMTESRLDTLEDDFLPLLSEGRYADAFDTFASDCERFLGKAFRFPWLRNLLIALALGLIVAFAVTHGMKSKLKSVRAQAAANSYIRQDSLQVTGSSDLFLYATVSKSARPKPSSSSSSGGMHTSSSGTSHGGRSGKF